jgi:multidrug efflux system outer membrane protein
MTRYLGIAHIRLYRLIHGIWFAIFILITLIGCTTVGPDYHPPEMSMPDVWHAPPKEEPATQGSAPESLASWWTAFNDTELNSLIEQAVSGNLALKEALARLREARASRGMVEADRYPTLDAGGSLTRSGGGKDAGRGQSTDLYALSFDAGWEIDIFGGVSRSVEAAEAEVQAGQEDLRDILVSFISEVALNYIDVRTYQARLTVTHANLDAQEKTYQLTLFRYQAGLSDELAVQQARYNLMSTRSQIPTLRSGLNEAMNRIAVLLGEQPGNVHGELEEIKPIPVSPLKIAVGVPADILRRRPDIRKAERNLAAATAQIGVAMSELYPKFKLVGSIGLESLSSGSLLSWANRIWQIGPGITWNIFNTGAVRQNIAAKTALRDQALYQYESTVLDALEEVKNALMAYSEEHGKRDDLVETTQAAQKAVDLAQQKYQAGLSDFSNILDAQRSLLSFQDQLVQSNGTIASNLVRLYKALGGGWTTMTGEEE